MTRPRADRKIRDTNIVERRRYSLVIAHVPGIDYMGVPTRTVLDLDTMRWRATVTCKWYTIGYEVVAQNRLRQDPRFSHPAAPKLRYGLYHAVVAVGLLVVTFPFAVVCREPA